MGVFKLLLVGGKPNGAARRGRYLHHDLNISRTTICNASKKYSYKNLISYKINFTVFVVVYYLNKIEQKNLNYEASYYSKK